MGLMLSTPQQTSKYFRAPGETTPTEFTEEEQAALGNPPANMYRLKVYALSDTFQMPIQPEYQRPAYEGGPPKTHSTNVRPVFEITEGPGKGKRFEGLLTAESFGPRTNLRKLWVACGLPMPEGAEFDLTDMIGAGEFKAFVTRDEKIKDGQKRVYSNVNWTTLEPVPTDAAAGAAPADDTW